jgi:hypothetical protein
MERGAPGRTYSGLMFAARITFLHFSVSLAISFPNSAGEPRQRRTTHIGKAHLEGGIRERGVDLLVEPASKICQGDAAHNGKDRAPLRQRRDFLKRRHPRAWSAGPSSRNNLFE